MKTILHWALLTAVIGGMLLSINSSRPLAAQSFQITRYTTMIPAPAPVSSQIPAILKVPLADSSGCTLSLGPFSVNFCQIVVRAIASTFNTFFGGLLTAVEAIDQPLIANGLLYGTPTAVTIDNSAVIAFAAYSTDLANASLVMILLFLGFKFLIKTGMREVDTIWDVLPRLALGAIGANVILWGLRQLIDFLNIVTLNIVWGTLSLPVLVDSSIWTFFIQLSMLVYFVLFLLIFLQILMRLALLDLLIVLSPVAVVSWILPETRGITQWWSQLLGSTLIVQTMQVILVSLGLAIATNPTTLSIPGLSTALIQAGLLIASMFMALRLPQILQHNLGKALQGTDSIRLGEQIITVITQAMLLASGISLGGSSAASGGNIAAEGSDEMFVGHGVVPGPFAELHSGQRLIGDGVEEGHYYEPAYDKNGNTIPFATYSDDGGETWRSGKDDRPVATPGPQGNGTMSESDDPFFVP